MKTMNQYLFQVLIFILVILTVPSSSYILRNWFTSLAKKYIYPILLYFLDGTKKYPEQSDSQQHTSQNINPEKEIIVTQYYGDGIETPIIIPVNEESNQHLIEYSENSQKLVKYLIPRNMLLEVVSKYPLQYQKQGDKASPVYITGSFY